MDYSPKVEVSYYRVESHCPVLIGRVLGWLGVPGFRSHVVTIATSEEATKVNVRNWDGHWSSIALGPVKPTKDSLDRLVRDFM